LFFSCLTLPSLETLQYCLVVITFVPALISAWEKIAKLKRPKGRPVWVDRLYRFGRAVSEAGKKSLNNE